MFATRKVFAATVMLLSMAVSCTAVSSEIQTRSGPLSYKKSGYPTHETVNTVFDEMAFHGATQAYLWGTAILVNECGARRTLASPVHSIS